MVRQLISTAFGIDRFMVSLSNHEAVPHRGPCEAFVVRQAHHEGFSNESDAKAVGITVKRPIPPAADVISGIM
jgi:hypothetical protein